MPRWRAEGFVEIGSHASASVKGWSRRDAEEMSDIRAHLEGLACGLAARNTKTETIAQLRELCGEMEQTAHNDAAPTQASKINRKSHSEILRLSGNGKLMPCETLMNLGFLYRSVSRFSQMQRVETSRYRSRN